MRMSNVIHLGIKELRSLMRDSIMLALIVFAFTLAIYARSTQVPESLNKAPIAIVDEDHSQLSQRIVDAFYPPYFMPPRFITRSEMDVRMDNGLDTFALDIPPGFQRDVLAGRSPAIQLNIDATRMTQSFTGGSYIQSILNNEVNDFVQRHQVREVPRIDLALRIRFNSELNKSWFGAAMEFVNNITMLAIVLTGAALIREREHGTVEHLLVMPITPLEIMVSKVWSMALVVLVGASLSLVLVIQWLLAVPIQGSLILFFAAMVLHLFATTSMGIFLATIARSMPQFALLMMLVLMPLQILSGNMTPRESMPEAVQLIMTSMPTTHFVALAQAILYRGADFSIVWPQFVALAVIGAVFFSLSLGYFRKTLASMA